MSNKNALSFLKLLKQSKLVADKSLQTIIEEFKKRQGAGAVDLDDFIQWIIESEMDHRMARNQAKAGKVQRVFPR